MALITCPKCGKQFSDRAEKCPQCGSPISRMSRMSRMSNMAKNVVSIASFALLLSCILFIISSLSLSFGWGLDLMWIIVHGLIGKSYAWYNVNITSFLIVITVYFFLQWNSSPLKEYKNITFIRFVFSSISLILICIELGFWSLDFSTLRTLDILLDLSLLIMGVMSIICSQKLMKPLKYYVITTEVIMLVVFAITNCYLPLGLSRITITGLSYFYLFYDGRALSLTFQLGMVICILFILLLFNRQYLSKVFKFQ